MEEWKYSVVLFVDNSSSVLFLYLEETSTGTTYRKSIIESVSIPSNFLRVTFSRPKLLDTISSDSDLFKTGIFRPTILTVEGLVDLLSRISSYKRLESDNSQILSFISETANFKRSKVDTLQLDDAELARKISSYILSASVNITDSRQLSRILRQLNLSTISLSDSVTREISYIRLATDILYYYDFLVTEETNRRTKSDSVSVLSDLLSSTKYSKSMTEVISFVDLLTTSEIYARLQSDIENAQDVSTTSRVYIKFIEDILQEYDSVFRDKRKKLLLVSYLTLSDTLFLDRRKKVLLSSLLEVSASLGASIDELFILIKDLLNISEATSLAAIFSRFKESSVAISEVITGEYSGQRSLETYLVPSDSMEALRYGLGGILKTNIYLLDSMQAVVNPARRLISVLLQTNLSTQDTI